MTRTLRAAAVLVTLTATTTACASGNDEAEHRASATPAAKPKAAAQTPARTADHRLTEPGKVASGTVALTDFGRGTETEGYAKPVPYLRYRLTLRNTSGKAVDLVDVASNCYGPGGKATAGIDAAGTDSVATNRVAPGGKASEVRACRLPKSASTVTIQVVVAGAEVTFGGSVPR